MEAADVLPSVVARRARRDPHAVAIEVIGGKSYSWSDLHTQALIWAGGLEGLGVSAGDNVCTLIPQSFEAHVSWLACAWSGTVEVSVNTLYRGSWLEHVLRDSGARVVVTSSKYLEQLKEALHGSVDVDTVVVYDEPDPPRLTTGQRVLGSREFVGEVLVNEDRLAPEPQDTACVIYTSGTTGPSKGVIMPWAQLHGVVTAELPPQVPSEEAAYVPFGPYHLTGKSPLYACALYGVRMVVREVFSVTEYWSDIRQYRCTTTVMLGVIAHLLLRSPRDAEADANPLRRVLMAPMIEDVDELKARFGFEVMSTYGMTEIGLPLFLPMEEASSQHWQTCGRVREGFELRVVDEHDRALPPGSSGELIVRSIDPWMLNQGYLGQPEESFRAWRNGWFHTGDRFRYDDEGYFYFVDRMKDSIRRRGENISSFEVEAAVMAHPDVAETAAVAVPSDVSEDDVMIFVVPCEGKTVEPAELLTWLAPRMPRFALPRYVQLIDSLPKTPSARIQKMALKAAGVGPSTFDAQRTSSAG